MKKNNVIDLIERADQPVSSRLSSDRLQRFKRRLDVQNRKFAVGTTLLSIVILATLANNSLMARAEAMHELKMQRGIASVPTGTTDAEDSLVNRLAKQDLISQASIGRRPTDLERLTIGYLEGNYAVQLLNGKIHELQFSQASADRTPKHIDDVSKFLESNRMLLPVQFEKSVKVDSKKDGESVAETYELVNHLSMPVAKVQFVTNSHGDLLGMQVDAVTTLSE